MGDSAGSVAVMRQEEEVLVDWISVVSMVSVKGFILVYGFLLEQVFNSLYEIGL